MDKEQIDLLKKVEHLTKTLDKYFSYKSKWMFSRYPLTFALLVIFGATMVSQGVKEVLLEIPMFIDRPFFMLICGIIVLVITGTLYKKLNK